MTYLKRTTKVSTGTPPPSDKPDFAAEAPEKCPKCKGRLTDYNAASAYTARGAGVAPSTALIVHLYICDWCRYKLFAPPRTNPPAGP